MGSRNTREQSRRHNTQNTKHTQNWARDMCIGLVHEADDAHGARMGVDSNIKTREQQRKDKKRITCRFVYPIQYLEAENA